jgi:hypothetical protein
MKKGGPTKETGDKFKGYFWKYDNYFTYDHLTRDEGAKSRKIMNDAIEHDLTIIKSKGFHGQKNVDDNDYPYLNVGNLANINKNGIDEKFDNTFEKYFIEVPYAKGGGVKGKKYDISFNVDHLSGDMADISKPILNLFENKAEIQKIQKQINKSEDGYDVDSPIMYKYDRLVQKGIMGYLKKIGLKSNQIELESDDESYSVMITNASQNVLPELKAFNPDVDEADDDYAKGGQMAKGGPIKKTGNKISDEDLSKLGYLGDVKEEWFELFSGDVDITITNKKRFIAKANKFLIRNKLNWRVSEIVDQDDDGMITWIVENKMAKGGGVGSDYIFSGYKRFMDTKAKKLFTEHGLKPTRTYSEDEDIVELKINLSDKKAQEIGDALESLDKSGEAYGGYIVNEEMAKGGGVKNNLMVQYEYFKTPDLDNGFYVVALGDKIVWLANDTDAIEEWCEEEGYSIRSTDGIYFSKKPKGVQEWDVDRFDTLDTSGYGEDTGPYSGYVLFYKGNPHFVGNSEADFKDIISGQYAKGGGVGSKGTNIDKHEYKYVAKYSFNKDESPLQKDILRWSSIVKDVLVKKNHSPYEGHFGIIAYAKNKSAAAKLIKEWSNYGIGWTHSSDFTRDFYEAGGEVGSTDFEYTIGGLNL